ncbi:hybrid sensor histidine kinase/response regulator transcription factor [Carboxylicivirga caseinilyticus]|uniref:hybrid sensor histidine kinase/response regulator transcription factor n=1 Tax=Carboxylicivirga caseinilyticus TaxID=3417572 RepID=UPI003D356FE5|nr:response regulator [Marinilabiliaceae bacterium A049]
MYRFQLIVFLSILSFSIKAQRIFEFDKLSIKDGFSSSRANSIIQDKNGYIWIGTWNGLNRYDGYEVKEYIPDFRDSATLSNREVVSLCEGRDDNLWIGTTSGLNCLNLKTNRIHSYPFQNRIISLMEDDEGDIWIGTTNGGLHILNTKTGEIKQYLGNYTISDICQDSRGLFWLATYNGLIRFDKKNQSNRFYYHDEDDDNSISNNTVTQVKESADGNLWIGTWGGGLNRIEVYPQVDSLHVTHYNSNPQNGNFPSNVIYRIFIDDFQNIWCGTWSSGLILIEAKEQKKDPADIVISHYKQDANDLSSLSGNNISSLFVDRTGILWVGSAQIDRTSIVKNGINRFKIEGETAGKFAFRNVRSFAQQDEYIWAGTSVELKLYKKNNEGYEYVKDIPDFSYQHNGYEFASSSIVSLEYNKHGLWVGTDDAGLIFYPGKSAVEKKNPAFRYFNTATNPALPSNKINVLKSSRKNENVLWVGTQQNGVAKLTYQDNKVTTEFIYSGSDNKHLSDNNIRTIYEDRDGFVWIGTQNGLNCYDPKTAEIKKYFHSFHEANAINDNVINVLYEDQSGNLWIGTNSGLNRKYIDRLPDGTEKIAFESYPHSAEIGNSIITNILEDESGLLWIKPYRGIVKFSPQRERVIKSYMTKEYLTLSVETNAGLRTSDGKIFLGEDEGFIYFYPDSLFKNSMAPKVCITDCIVLNQSVLNHKNKERILGDTIVNSVPFINDLHFSYKDQVITFMFSAMDYKDPQRNVYAYFLEGYDNIWNEVGTRNSATYTNIPPGDYIFHVNAANSDGHWSEEAYSIRFSITPPWWKTIWALIGYAIIIIATLYFFKEYSLIQVREKSRIKLELLQKEKEQHLNELKTLFFTDITHEFRTPLTLIQGPAEELKKLGKESPYMVKQADLILKNTNRLLRLINQLMDFRKIDRGKMDLQLQVCNVSQLMKDLHDSYKGMAETRGIDLELEMTQDKLMAYVDGDKLEKIMYNLVSNAFKYSDDNGEITIRAAIEKDEEDKEVLAIEVEDDGIGIDEENKKRIFERFFQTHQKRTHSTGGIGLYLSKTFVEQHGGTIEVDSDYGQGSCFRVVIPTRSDELASHMSEEPIPSEVDYDVEVNEVENVPVVMPHDSGKVFDVLIVEDDSDLNDFIVSGLSNEFNVVGVFNGNEGYSQAKALNPDIIVTDVMMPGIDGFEMCRQIRNDISTSHIPVIFLTAKTMAEDEIRGLELGAIDYIHKPFNINALQLKVHNILQGRKKLHEHIRKEQILEPENIELTSLDEKLLKDAVDAVNKYLDDPTFDVVKFSEVIGLSANQAYRKIKALTGQTVKEFIRNQRLKTAASLLLQKKRSISEIIYMVGFSSPSYFTRCFKEFYKCTPKEYIANDGKVDQA